MREWPKNGKDQSPGALLLGDGWQSPPDATGPFVFVFELTAPAVIERFVIASSSSPDVGAKSVRIEGSLSGADAGYSDIGVYAMDPNGAPGTFPLNTPTRARWLRVTLEPRGPKGMDIRLIEAYGALETLAAPKSIAGTWLLDPWPKLSAAQDELWNLPGRLPQHLDWKTSSKSHFLLKMIRLGDEFRALECNNDGTYADTLGAVQNGANVTWQSLRLSVILPPGSVNAEGDMLVGNGYMAFRVNDSSKCQPPEPPKGSGRKILVLTTNGSAITYPPYDHPESFPGFRFVPQFVAQFAPGQLAGVDTVELFTVCEASTIFAKAQTAALLDFVAAGHKLIMHDADGCVQSGYAFMPYPFTTSNVGAKGAHGKDLVLVESSTLGSDKSDPAHFIDAGAYARYELNQLGDANVVISEDPHWCGHLFGENANHQNGFMHMYAPYGRGLLIYDGFDVDDWRIPEYRKLIGFEIAQPVPYTRKCTQPVTGSFLIAPSVDRSLPQGSATTLHMPLQVLSNRGYSGVVDIATSAPAEAQWKMKLSARRVTLKSDVKPLNVALDVPADARPGDYVFKVTGTDPKGQSASATITLTITNPPPKKIERALEKSKRIAIYGIHFDFNSATVRKESQPVIRDIADILKQHADWKLTIEGHTDNVGGAAYNLDLSKRRAEAVKTILVARYAVAAARLSSAGYGFSHPKASNASEAGRAENRRVELVRR